MDHVMEYVFFDKALASKFKRFCEQLNIRCQIQQSLTHTEDDEFTVLITEELSDEVTSKVEDRYSDMLFGEQAAQIEGNSSEGALADGCGVQIQLQSGEFTNVAVDPEIMNKILSVLSTDELQRFLAQVAEDIENPKSSSICSRAKI